MKILTHNIQLEDLQRRLNFYSWIKKFKTEQNDDFYLLFVYFKKKIDYYLIKHDVILIILGSPAHFSIKFHRKQSYKIMN